LGKPTETLYYGYWIRSSGVTEFWWIEKDQHYITSCKGLEDGKRIVNEYLATGNSSRDAEVQGKAR
jgi:hypothetical protein